MRHYLHRDGIRDFLELLDLVEVHVAIDVGGFSIDPVHVHGKCQGRESRAEIVVVNGRVTTIRYSGVIGRLPLETNEMRYFEEVVGARADDIVAKWIDFFVLHKPVKSERITRRLK